MPPFRVVQHRAKASDVIESTWKVRGNPLPLHEIASADKVSLTMTEERCHSGLFTPCHSDPERSEWEESHNAQDRLLEQSQEIATPSARNDPNGVVPSQSARAHKRAPASIEGG